VVGLILGVLSLLVGAVSVWWTIHSEEEAKIKALTEASATAEKTMTAAHTSNP
jgi:hypothetical protein